MPGWLVVAVVRIPTFAAKPSISFRKNDRFSALREPYALVDVPNAWKGDRNPVKYSTLEQLGIDPSFIAPRAAVESITIDRARSETLLAPWQRDLLAV